MLTAISFIDGQNLESVSSLPMRSSKLKRSLYRRAYHRKNKLRENAKNKENYHNVYKGDHQVMESRRNKWREYYKSKGQEWSRLRSRRYRKSYSKLSESQRFKKREAYKKWANQNWGDRVEYAI